MRGPENKMPSVPPLALPLVYTNWQLVQINIFIILNWHASSIVVVHIENN